MTAMNRTYFAILLATIAGGVPAAEPEPVVLNDEFDGAALARHWRVRTGQWAVRNAVLANRRPGGRLLCGESDWQDYQVTVRMRTTLPGAKPWSVGRLLFRYRDAGNHYYLLLHRTGLLELGRERAGEHHPGLAQARTEAVPTDWHVLMTSVVGNRIRVSLDGRPVLSYDDPTPLKAGRTGFDAFQNSRVEASRFTVRSASIQSRRREGAERRMRVLKKLGYRRSGKGNVAVFRDTGVPVVNSCPSAPETLGMWLGKAGYGVTFLTARELADPVVLSPALFDVLILPYGEAFPYKAVTTFRRYLEHGGNLLTTGGYFGNHIYGAENDGDRVSWIDNGGFEKGHESWGPSTDIAGFDQRIVPAGPNHGQCARLEVREGTALDWYSIEQALPALKPGRSFRCTARIRTRDIRDGYGAYVAINYFRKTGERIRWKQSRAFRETAEWQTVTVRDTVPPGTARTVINLILHGHGVAFFDDVRVFPGSDTAEALNTATGDIHGPGNSLRVAPEQIGLFAPNYPLENIVEVRSSRGQGVIPASLGSKLAVRGWSASGLFLGNGNPVHAVSYARPIHLLDALDAFGRVRGRAGVLVRNYRGMYAGSNWAAFGITDLDLFARDSALGKTLLLGTVDALRQKTFIAEAGTELACYRPGEEPIFVAEIAQYGGTAVDGEVTFTVRDAASPEQTVFRRTVPLHIDADAVSADVSASWPAPALSGDFYRVRVELRTPEVSDSVENAFVVWHDDRLADGPRVSIRDAHLQWNDRGRLLCGASDAGYPYFSPSETPIVWDRQFRLMRDFGLHCYRCMHFFSGLPKTTILTFEDYERAGDEVRRRIRRLDALVYLAQKHDVLFLFVDNCGLQAARDAPEELAARKRLLTLLARRYRHVSSFLFNLDHQEFIRKPTPGNNGLFRRFLERKYTTAAEFAEAWGAATPKDGVSGVVFAPNRIERQRPYSAPARDVGEFLDRFREAWRLNHADAVHAGNPRAVLSQDFSLYWQPDFRWPEPAVLRRLDMVSAHFYGAEADLPVRARRIDMQALGKPSGLTEFGILTHPAWRGHRDVRLTHDGADAFFAMATHYAFAFDMSLMTTWDWKEMRECIFPWSIAYHDLVPKPHMLAFRNLALFLGSITPVYTPPSVFVVCPSSRYLDGDHVRVEHAVNNCIRRLLDLRVNFGMIGEQYLDRLPSSAGLLFVPSVDRSPRSVRIGLAEFAARGNTVCLWTSESAAAQVVPGSAIEATSKFGPDEVFFLCTNGSGHVLVCEAPVARHGIAGSVTRGESGGGAQDLYERALSRAEVAPLPVVSRPAGVRAFSVRTRTDGVCYVLHNPGKERCEVRITHAGHILILRLAANDTGFAEFSADGGLRAMEGRDGAELDGMELFRGKGRIMLMALDADNLDGASAPRLILFIGEADMRLRTPQTPGVAWRAEFGEFRDGRWTVLQSVVPEKGNGTLRLQATGPLRSAMALAVPARRLSSARRAAQALLH